VGIFNILSCTYVTISLFYGRTTDSLMHYGTGCAEFVHSLVWIDAVRIFRRGWNWAVAGSGNYILLCSVDSVYVNIPIREWYITRNFSNRLWISAES
jgi:hypothetical protein